MSADSHIDGSDRDPMSRVVIDGVPIDPLTEDEVVTRVMAEDSGSTGGLLLTANADILRHLRRPQHLHLADDASLVVADGMPLVWASRLQGEPVPERVAGADLVWSLARATAAAGGSLYLLGAGPGVAKAAAEVFRQKIPSLRIAGFASPPVGFHQDPVGWENVRAAVTTAQPTMVYVALGFPKQEQVALRLLESLPQAWFLGCGGSLDMVAGRVRRAPQMFQVIGAEWAHRLLLEPRRLVKRYLVDDLPYVLGLLVRAAVIGRRRGRLSRQTPGADNTW